MRQRSRVAPAPIHDSLLEAWIVNDAINQLLLEHLDPRAWQAKPPRADGRPGRTIAAIVSHMHNIRRKWVRLSAPHLKLSAELDRSCTLRQARAAMAQSARACSHLLAQAFDPAGRVRHFHRDGWARSWPVGGVMFAYMLSHEAHHRGQICMLAHQLGFPLSNRTTSEMWCWEKHWKATGGNYLNVSNRSPVHGS
ncbi:MAG TPA: DinB family protein [Terriglobales bacterium]|nr:DinB family protein [Terriglobales bacterium]